ncbi:MAG: Dead-box ATP-dependent RNA helicase [Candidatus Magasanikbacteria bacterium GW2011_GWC2_37_14]|uniref:Dead-box ATP-dependent RNA helicase n=1 Tax=Candidatus Magasanikbacteria bacterium GW2011_GWC2_37_14 TaxID=1619046 RepID=A0A0G0GL02_9BACT|nr:MAG: Dead-box ATP-dependent RNA helicase [Candidatus Magasanikbacteria bacterium GW2011_GWC2_37_14]
MTRVGMRVTIYMTIEQKASSFSELGISAKILSILEFHGFKQPTPIQHQAIPPALEGKDLIGIAQTGTGKTLAFGIPMIQRLNALDGQGLILLPTRELALQVDETLQKIGGGLGLRTVVLIGGAPMPKQMKEIARSPHIIVATPGRLADHLKRRTINLSRVKIAVLDEADRMFDIGFAPQIKEILSLLTSERQTMLFSATMSAEIAKLASRYLKLPLRIEVAPAGTTVNQIEQEVFFIDKENRMQLLDKILMESAGRVLVFSRTKHGAKKITNALKQMNYSATEIHSNKSLAQRKDALSGFKTGKYRVLVATDIAARGIDVKEIELVVNFDMPDDLENYVHRIGRTGRAGHTGKAISFAGRDEKSSIRNIERLIRKTLPILEVPVLPPKRQIIEQPRENNYSRGRSFGGFRGEKSKPAGHNSFNYPKRKRTGSYRH